MTKPRVHTVLANGPIEITLGNGNIEISSLAGPLIRILSARHVVFHYLDHEETQIFGDTSLPLSN